MILPGKHEREDERLHVLSTYEILDTAEEEDYDCMTRLASEICQTPIALVTFIDSDRQWFKSHHGLVVRETPREYAFCAHAITDPSPLFVVSDATKDKRFHDNPLVVGEPQVVFYAGMKLQTDDGLPLGTLCVIDHKPKQLSDRQIQALDSLSKQVMNLLKLRKSNRDLEETVTRLAENNRDLERFAFMAAHDIRAPLNSILGLTKLFRRDYQDQVDQEGRETLQIIEDSTSRLQSLIESLLDFSRKGHLLKERNSQFHFSTFLEEIEKEIQQQLDTPPIYIHDIQIGTLRSNKSALHQVFANLLTNAIRYNDKSETRIRIEASEENNQYLFAVQDNGPGISRDLHERIFDMFEVGQNTDRYGKDSHGIGLATVKRVVQLLGGHIHLESTPGEGSRFAFTIEKSGQLKH